MATRSLRDAIATTSSQLKDLASDVNHAELMRAARRGTGPEVTTYGRLCPDAIDRRAATHCSGGQFALSAAPLWLAIYRGDHSSATALLEKVTSRGSNP